jgi:hypothetical protein
VAVPSVITDLSATAASNSPAGGDAVFPDLDNYLRAHASLIRYGDTKAANVASATNIDLGAAVGRVVDVTGTTTVASFGTVSAGVWRIVRFTGALTLTYNATSLILPGAASITTAAGDCAIAVSLGSGNWIVTHYQSAGASGRVSASRSAAQTITAGGYETVVFDTEAFDTSAAYDAGTGVFTAPVAGIYRFDATVSISGTAGDSVFGQFIKNGTRASAFRTTLAESIQPETLSLVVSLAATDTIAFQLYPVNNNASVLAGLGYISGYRLS